MLKTIRMFTGAAVLGLTVAACGDRPADDPYTDPALTPAPAVEPAPAPQMYDPNAPAPGTQPHDTLGMPADTFGRAPGTTGTVPPTN
jgi:hypothetical protein